MEKSTNIYTGEYGVRECLLALKNEAETELQNKKKELESQISDQLAECEKLEAERDANKEEIEREYSIRIRNNNKDIERYKKDIEEAEKQQAELEKELAACSFVAVGKKKSLSEKIEDVKKQLTKLANNLRVAETTASELNEAKEKKINKLSSALNKAKEAISGVTDVIDTYNEQIDKLQKKQEEYKALDDFDIHKLLNRDEVLKDYVFYLLKGTDKGITFTELQHRNVVFALIPDVRVGDAIKALMDENVVTETVEGDNAYFVAN